MSPSCDAPDLSGLIELSRDPQLDLKPVVLRVQTDLFLAAPIRDRAAIEAFASLATGLIPMVDEDTALLVAGKLGSCPDTPLAVLTCLAARGGVVLDAIEQSDVWRASRLADTTVREAESVTPRITPSEAVTSAPAETVDEPQPAPAPVTESTNLADEDDSPGADESVQQLIERARRDPDLARTLLSRADVAAADLAPLWLLASRPQRRAIREAVASTAMLRPCPPAPQDIATGLCELATNRDVGGFITMLAEALGLTPNFVAAAPDSASRYDLVALAMRAADLRESDAIYVFLTLNETVARSVERVFELADLYRETSRPIARDLLSAVLDAPLPERTTVGEHKPYLAPDARPRYAPSTERALARAVAPERIRKFV